MATATNTRTPKGEKAVRDYLAFLINPSDYIDKRLVNQLQRKFDKEKDPVAKVALWQQIVDAKIPNGSKVQAAFIKNAKNWSESTGISVDTLIEVFNVPRGVLRDAGFNVRTTQYKPRVTSAKVRACIEEQGEFAISDIVEMTGASDAGVRNVVREMENERRVEIIGKDKSGDGNGKKPLRYRAVTLEDTVRIPRNLR